MLLLLAHLTIMNGWISYDGGIGGLDLGGSSMSTSSREGGGFGMRESGRPSSSFSTTPTPAVTARMSGQLSRAQMSAMANLVVMKKNQRNKVHPMLSSVTRSRSAGELKLTSSSAPPTEADRAEEASITQLLDTFAHLGFNKESLARVMAEDNDNSSSITTAAAANTAARAMSPPSTSTFDDTNWSTTSSSSSLSSTITVAQPMGMAGVGSPRLQSSSPPQLIDSSLTLSTSSSLLPSSTLGGEGTESVADIRQSSSPSPPLVLGMSTLSSLPAPLPPPPGLTIIPTLPASMASFPPPHL
jgi:hypothetical protein